MKELVNTLTGPATKCADLHTHTKFSDGRYTPFEAVDMAAARGISAIALSDHNTLLTSVVAAHYAKENGIAVEIIPGSEIATVEGHMIVLFQQDDIPRNLSVVNTIIAAHEQDALIIPAHPFLMSRGIGIKNCLEVLQSEDDRVYFDGFEVENKGVSYIPRITHANDKALSFYREYIGEYAHKLGAAVGSSDNHFFALGGARTWYNGGLREAISRRQTMVTTNTVFEDLVTLSIAHANYGPRALQRYYELQARQPNQ